MANIVTLPVVYVDGSVLTASDLNSNFNTLNAATIPVSNGGTGLTGGTSGGVPYFSSASAIGSSGVLTQYGVLYGGGAGAAPAALGAMTNGQLVIGSTGAAPVIASLTAGSGITVTPGAGSLTIAATTTAGAVTRTAGDVTTTSTTLVDLTGASITITTAARRVLLTFTCTTQNTNTPTFNTFQFDVDGTGQFGTSTTSGVAKRNNAGSETDAFSMSFLTGVLSAGSHTFKVQWCVNANTGTVRGNTTNPYHFSAVETMATT